MKLYKIASRGGSLTVTLPPEWLRKCGLQEGDYVDVRQSGDGALTIRPAMTNDET